MFSTARSRALTALALAALAALAGCSGGSDDPLLAVVGDAEIRVSEYNTRLSLLEQNELPRDRSGRPYDMAATEGRTEFLTTLIRKELMVAKSLQLGYASEQQAVDARRAMLSYEAGLAMSFDNVNKPGQNISEEALQAFYSRLGEVRLLRYIVTNFEYEARSASDMARGGADWDDVADKWHRGEYPDNGPLEVQVPWGRFAQNFEQEAFDLEEGEVSGPIHTDYGWWIVRVERIDHSEKPDLEANRAEIEKAVQRRTMTGLQTAFRQSIYEEYKVEVMDEGLAVIWEALPSNEIFVNPETDEPIAQEDLVELEVRAADRDILFYSYEIDGERKEFTVGDYKSNYDKMNTFQRPKREQMVGGLHLHIRQMLWPELTDREATLRGYMDDLEVVAKVDKKLEGMMVNRLYAELVVVENDISEEEFDTFWAENHDRYSVPERRSGRLLVAADAEAGAAARAEILGGKLWRDVIQEYGTDAANKGNSGKLDEITSRQYGTIPDALFALAAGEVSEPFALGDGRFCLVRCDRILPGEAADPVTSREKALAGILAERKENRFLALLDEWAAEFGVTRHDENLEFVKTWKELIIERLAEQS